MTIGLRYANVDRQIGTARECHVMHERQPPIQSASGRR